jgi:hypothetical protein
LLGASVSDLSIPIAIILVLGAAFAAMIAFIAS